MRNYDNPEKLVELISNQFNLRVCGCYDVDISESICIQRKGKEFSVRDIQAYIDIILLADCEEEEEYLVNIEYCDGGFLAIKKLDDSLFLYMTSSYNFFPYVQIFLKNLDMMAGALTINDDIFLAEENQDAQEHQNGENLLAAKQIQDLVLSDEKILDKYFDDHFLFYRPQEIIGGDFYSFIEFDDVLYVVIGDCTGHSVEGALATMVVSSILKEVIVDGSLEVSSIINKFYEKVDHYNENITENNTYGLGVEIGICKIEKNAMNMHYASSGIILVHQSTNGQKISKIKNVFDDRRNFYMANFSVHKGETIVMFSDGIPDQFDKKDEHRLGKSGIKRMLAESCRNVIDMEKSFLSKFDGWRGTTPQLDDQTLLCATI
ncbi:MAG: SpoIIE family protein phosphatase [Cytophagales bacterium]|nr:SpoIIE family protein phosphatase [Cytophagales bacterium]